MVAETTPDPKEMGLDDQGQEATAKADSADTAPEDQGGAMAYVAPEADKSGGSKVQQWMNKFVKRAQAGEASSANQPVASAAPDAPKPPRDLHESRGQRIQQLQEQTQQPEAATAEGEAAAERPEGSSIEVRLTTTLTETAEAIHNTAEQMEAEVGSYDEAVRQAHDIIDQLGGLGASRLERAGLHRLGRETLAGRMAMEAATVLLLQASRIVAEGGNTAESAQAARDFCMQPENEAVWDLLPRHQRLAVQRAVEDQVVAFIGKPRALAERQRYADSLFESFNNIWTETKYARQRMGEFISAAGKDRLVANLEGVQEQYQGNITEYLQQVEGVLGEARGIAEQMPEGSEARQYFSDLVGDIQQLYDQYVTANGGIAPEGQAQDPTGAAQMMHEITTRLSELDQVLTGDPQSAGARLLSRLPIGGEQLATIRSKIDKMNKLGRRVTERAAGAVENIDLKGRVVTRERGGELSGMGPDTVRNAERRVLAMAERAQQLQNTMAELRNVDWGDPHNPQAILESTAKLTELRTALPLMAQLREVSDTNDARAILGASAAEMADADRARLTEEIRAIAEELLGQAEGVEGVEVVENPQQVGQELLAVIAVNRVMDIYGVGEEEAKQLLAEGGERQWMEGQAPDADEGVGVGRVHRTVTRGVRRGAAAVQERTGLLNRVSPREILGIGLDADGNPVILNEAGRQRAESMGRLAQVVGPEGSLEGVDVDTLRRDLAVMESINVTAGAAGLKDRVLGFLRRGEIKTMATMKQMERIQKWVENGVAAATEVVGVILTVQIADKLVTEGTGMGLGEIAEMTGNYVKTHLEHLGHQLGLDEAVRDTKQALLGGDINVQIDGVDQAEAAQYIQDGEAAIRDAIQADFDTAQDAVDSTKAAQGRWQFAQGVAQQVGALGQRLRSVDLGPTAVAGVMGVSVAAAEAYYRNKNRAVQTFNRLRGRS